MFFIPLINAGSQSELCYIKQNAFVCEFVARVAFGCSVTVASILSYCVGLCENEITGFAGPIIAHHNPKELRHLVQCEFHCELQCAVPL